MRAEAPALSTEWKRKAVHVGCGVIALSFRWLTWPQALLLSLGALAFNALLLPRVGGRSLHRGADLERGWAVGILLYPLSVALLVLAFGPWRGLAIPAMGWALMAFGDGMASVVGMRFGRIPLPWNPRKSLEGFLAFVMFGAVAASALGDFVLAGRGGATRADIVVAACVAAVVAALLESLDSGIDDNLIVPLSGALVADVVLVAMTSGAGLASRRALVALAACALLGALAWWRRSLTLAGAAAAALLGTGVAAWGGWGAFATLCAFFALGVSATRMGRRVKEARGIAQERGGRRGLGNVVANGGVAGLCAFYAAHGGFVDPLSGAPEAALVALVAALATAAFDTVSSEVGKAYGRTTVLVTTLRRVPPGTEGAVSLEGTLAGVAAAVVVGLVGIPSLLGWSQASLIPLVVVPAAFVGTTFESVVGATFERRGVRIHNDVLNFANTLVGALAAAALMAVAT